MFRHMRATIICIFLATLFAFVSGCVATRMTKEEASQVTENAKKLIEMGLDEEAYNLLSEVVDAFPLEPVPNMLFQYSAGRSGHSAVVFERYEQLAFLMPQSAAAQCRANRFPEPAPERFFLPGTSSCLKRFIV